MLNEILRLKKARCSLQGGNQLFTVNLLLLWWFWFEEVGSNPCVMIQIHKYKMVQITIDFSVQRFYKVNQWKIFKGRGAHSMAYYHSIYVGATQKSQANTATSQKCDSYICD